MTEEIKRIIEELKDNIPIEEYRSEGTSDGLTHYEEDKDSWQYKLLDYITNLKKDLEISKDNAEAYRLEMQEITKIFGLDEHTLFDDVKEYATNLQEENKTLKEYKENATRKHWQQKCAEHHIQEKIYKSRIEKIIAHLGNCDWNNKDFEKIYDIAIGSDEE